MHQSLRTLAPILALLPILFVCHTAAAQKRGGVLKTYDPDSPVADGQEKKHKRGY